MHQVIRLLSRVADRYAPSRILSFDLAHIFKAMQMMESGKASRSKCVQEMGLGEGSIKTLVKHLKMNGLIENSNAGMWLTDKGRTAYMKLCAVIPAETDIPKCSIVLGRYNHAVLIRGFAHVVRTGIEQRDIAIKNGAVGATTLIFRDGKLTMPNKSQDALRKEPKIYNRIMENLRPEDEDCIIITSADDRKAAEMSAKNTVLQIISEYEKHA
jgi:predicted transcriptional regulator